METIRELVSVRIPRRFGLDPRRDVQVLTPMRRGPLGTGEPEQGAAGAAEPGGTVPCRAGPRESPRRGPGHADRRTTTSWACSTATSGAWRRCTRSRKPSACASTSAPCATNGADLDELEPAYACSIHKSQGSEFPGVVIALHTQHFLLLKRNLLYTAVTRGKAAGDHRGKQEGAGDCREEHGLRRAMHAARRFA